MRENRLSGSEGGAAETNRPSLPLSTRRSEEVTTRRFQEVPDASPDVVSSPFDRYDPRFTFRSSPCAFVKGSSSCSWPSLL